jgi:S1-C subfamily serine protease
MTTLDFWREGAVRRIEIKLRDRPLAPEIQKLTPPEADIRPAVEDRSPLGITVHDLDPAYANRLRIPDTIQGVVVIDIDPAGPARLADVRPNAVILEANRHRIGSETEFRAVVSKLGRGEPAALLMYDSLTHERTIAVVMPDQP